jgi:hypothetical protein
MSRKRDWDKVERERRAYQKGTLPFWWDGWPAGNPTGFDKPLGLPITPQSKSSQEVGPAILAFEFDPYLDLDRRVLERLFAMKLSLDLRIRVRNIRLICPKVPIEIYQLFFQFEGIAEAWLQLNDWALIRHLSRGDGDVDRINTVVWLES